ncbi:MAG: hypothetical protein RLZZ221_2435 [Verrucomicrobiota bacterium]
MSPTRVRSARTSTGRAGCRLRQTHSKARRAKQEPAPIGNSHISGRRNKTGPSPARPRTGTPIATYHQPASGKYRRRISSSSATDARKPP